MLRRVWGNWSAQRCIYPAIAPKMTARPKRPPLAPPFLPLARITYYHPWTRQNKTGPAPTRPTRSTHFSPGATLRGGSCQRGTCDGSRRAVEKDRSPNRCTRLLHLGKPNHKGPQVRTRCPSGPLKSSLESDKKCAYISSNKRFVWISNKKSNPRQKDAVDSAKARRGVLQ